MQNNEVSTITGSCLCGAVTYQISGALGDIVHCHCETCRKAHGSAFSSVAAVADADFRLAGELKSYESSPGKLRYFCGNCGTQIYAKRSGTGHKILRLGSLDDQSLQAAPDLIPRERNHIWTEQQACWYQRDSELPAYAGFEPESEPEIEES